MAFFKFRKGFDGKTAVAPSPQESVETMRRRAKHRLLGASVLVLVAVIGFPLLFDAQPRPVSVDIPIEIPDKDKIKPLAIPAALAPLVSPVTTAASAPAASTVPSASVTTLVKPLAPAPAPAQAPAKPVAAAPATVAAAASIGTKEEIISDKPAAKGAIEASQAAASASGEARFVVQVGAFADAEKAREVRQRLERAGLKTYAQVVDTKEGKRTRVRVGPFPDRATAEQTAEKIKALEFPVVVLTL